MSELKLALRVPAEISPEQVRIRMMGTEDDPLFRLSDVCKVNGVANIGNVAARLDDDEKCNIQIVDVMGRPKKVVFVNEGGFYQVVMSFRTPRAKAFRKWITGKVLPSIRKHGSYPPPAAVPRPTLRPYSTRVMQMPAIRRNVPAGYWCIFTEAADLLIWAEQLFIPAGLAMDEYHLLDGSVGAFWPRFREGKPWAGVRVQYVHQFPDGDRRGARPAWAYPMSELQYFREWLHTTYIVGEFPGYLERKYGGPKMLKAAPALRRLGLNIPPITKRLGQSSAG